MTKPKSGPHVTMKTVTREPGGAGYVKVTVRVERTFRFGPTRREPDARAEAEKYIAACMDALEED